MRFRGGEDKGVRDGYVVFSREREGGMEWFWYGLRDGSNPPMYGSDVAVPDLSFLSAVCSTCRPSRMRENISEER